LHSSKTSMMNTLPYLNLPYGVVSEMTYTVSSGTLNSTIPYHTLPYGEDVLPPSAALRPLMSPMHIPELTVRLQNPQVQYTPRSIPTLGTTPLPSEGLLTWTYLPINMHSWYLQENICSKAHKHIHPGHHDQQDSKPGKSRRPIPESSRKLQNTPSATLTWVHSKIGITT